MLLYTGVRVSELVNIKLKDIDVLAMNLTVAWGKGVKRREVPLKGEDRCTEGIPRRRTEGQQICRKLLPNPNQPFSKDGQGCSGAVVIAIGVLVEGCRKSNGTKK